MIDGRTTLSAELHDSDAGLQKYVREEIRNLVASRDFQDALPGYLLPDAASQARIRIVFQRLAKLAAL